MKEKIKRARQSFESLNEFNIEQSLRKLRFFHLWQTHLGIILTLMFIYFYIDRPIATFFYHHHAALSFLNSVNWLHGLIVIAILILLTLVATYLKRTRWQHCFGFAASWLIVTYFICGVLKVIVGRARPNEWILNHIFGFFGPYYSDVRMFQSFPSGHTTTWMAVMLGFSLFFPNSFGRLILIGLLFSLTRVALAEHYLSDVLGTTYLMIMGLIALLTYMGFSSDKYKSKSRRHS